MLLIVVILIDKPSTLEADIGRLLFEFEASLSYRMKTYHFKNKNKEETKRFKKRQTKT